jgi:hypothetical protein
MIGKAIGGGEPVAAESLPTLARDSEASSSVLLMKNHDARVKRLYALAEKIGRLSGETHNLVSDLSAKMVARRAAARSTNPVKPPGPRHTKKT